MRKLLTLSCQGEEEEKRTIERKRDVKIQEETVTRLVKCMTCLMKQHPQIDFCKWPITE